MVVQIRFFILFVLILSSCKVQYQKLIRERQEYHGTQINTNGYYYNIHSAKDTLYKVDMLFFYRNGVIYDPARVFVKDSAHFEKEFFEIYGSFEPDKNIPYTWGIFFEEFDELVVEGWAPPAGFKHPRSFFSYTILNDSTILYDHFDLIYRFKPYSPKPDSTNNFIK